MSQEFKEAYIYIYKEKEREGRRGGGERKRQFITEDRLLVNHPCQPE